MLSNECWLGGHDVCPLPETCDCLCHAEFDWDEEIKDTYP